MSEKSVITWFQIPTRDIARAQAFYETVLGVSLAAQDMPGMKLRMFPGMTSGVGGALVESEHDRPSADGATVFFDGGARFDEILDRVERAGGKLVVPKTPIGEFGVMAQFIDTEGNRVALHGG